MSKKLELALDPQRQRGQLLTHLRGL